MINKVFQTEKFLCSSEVLCNHEYHCGRKQFVVHGVQNLVQCHSLYTMPLISAAGAFNSKHTQLLSLVYRLSFQLVRCHISQFQRCFCPNTIHIWNSLGEVCAADSLQLFKSRDNLFLSSYDNDCFGGS